MASLPENPKGHILSSWITAQPKTCVIEIAASGAILRTPVIGWAPDADNIYKSPHPITLNGMVRLDATRAIEFPNGMVHDQFAPMCFTDADEWVAYREKNPKAVSTAAPASKPSKAASTASDEPAELEIDWTDKSFKTNSYYRYEKGDIDFIFEVPGGHSVPKQKDPISKIKRDEFMSMKKSMNVAEIDDLQEGIYPGMEPLGEDFEGDEDDGEDLL